MESKAKAFTIIMIMASSNLFGCGGTRHLAQSSSQVNKKEIIYSKINKEKITNAIIEVMNRSGYRTTSANQFLLTFEKDVTSGGESVFFGHGKQVKVTFTIVEGKDSTKINGDIVGIMSGSPGLFTSVHQGGWQKSIDLSNNERAQKHLTLLMEQVEAALKD